MISKLEMESLLKKNEALFYSLAKRYSRSRDCSIDLNDLIQEARMAFIEYVTHNGGFEGSRGSIGAYIVKALCKYRLKNEIVNIPYDSYMRMNKEQRTGLVSLRAGDAILEEVTDTSGNDKDMKILFCDFLSRLPPSQREVAQLKSAGYRRREIAKMTGLPESTLRRRIDLVSSKLRKELAMAS